MADPSDPNAPPDPTAPPTNVAGQGYLSGGFFRPFPTPQTMAGPPDAIYGQRPFWRGPMGGMYSWRQPGESPFMGPRQPQMALPPESQQEAEPAFAPGRGDRWRAPYIPAAPRAVRDIGQDWWPVGASLNYPGPDAGPSMPSGREALGIFSGAGRQLQQWSAPGVGQPAGRLAQLAMQYAPFLDALSKGQFSRNFMAARLGQYKAMEEEMSINAAQAIQEQQRMLQDFGEVFKNYELGGYGNDPATASKQAEADMDRLAWKYNHTNLIAILKNKGLAGAQGWLTWEDQKLRDMMSGYAAHSKSSKDRDGSEYFSDGGGTGFGGENPVERLPLTGPGGVPIQRPDAPAGTKTPAATVDSVNKSLGKYNLSPAGMDAVKQAIGGEALPKGFAGADKLDAAEREGRAGISAIASGPGSQEDKLAEISKFSPDIAERIKGIANYDLDPKEYQIQGRQRYLDWARLITNGRYNTGNYAAVQQFMNKQGKEFQSVFRSNTAASGFSNVLRALNRFGPNEQIPIQRLANMIVQNAVTTGDKYDDLYSALRQYSIESNAVGSGSGVPRVTLVENLLRHAKAWASPSQIAVQLQDDLVGAQSVVEGYHTEWARLKGDGSPMPGIKPNTLALFDTYRRMNPHTGEMPSDAPPEAAILSQHRKAAKGDDWTPLTRADNDLLVRKYNDPDTPIDVKRAIAIRLHGIL